jgi:hypothetical protein
MTENASEDRQQIPNVGADPPDADAIRNYLLYTLSLPERALRSSVGLVGGAVRESAGLLVPQALRDSQTYRVMVQQTLDFLVQDIGGVAKQSVEADQEPQVEQFVARKTVGNFVEMAGLATLHLSPLLVLAVVSDVAYGSKAYLSELADELRKSGVIDEKSTINSTNDLLEAIGSTARVASSAFNAPPLSIEGLRETVEQTANAARRIDVADALPQNEIARIWQEMHELAAAEHVSLLEISSAMTLHALGKVANVGRGALSAVRIAGKVVDRQVLDHYRTALADIHQRGYYATLAATSGPYIEGVWQNFSTDRSTITEELCSGRLLAKGAGAVARWLGYGCNKNNDE